MFRVLFLCTENACRSQMAEGLVNHDLAGQVKAFSAGVAPKKLDPRAVTVMREMGLDLSQHYSKSVDDLPEKDFDLVITVCDQAREQCPIFPGKTEVMHLGFSDPAQAGGRAKEIMGEFRRVRDELRARLIPLLRIKAAAL